MPGAAPLFSVAGLCATGGGIRPCLLSLRLFCCCIEKGEMEVLGGLTEGRVSVGGGGLTEGEVLGGLTEERVSVGWGGRGEIHFLSGVT